MGRPGDFDKQQMKVSLVTRVPATRVSAVLGDIQNRWQKLTPVVRKPTFRHDIDGTGARILVTIFYLDARRIVAMLFGKDGPANATLQ
tara:strand:- start:207 stop:470 length:264 start_codon:yes stop_codon:yes gene_type:complete